MLPQPTRRRSCGRCCCHGPRRCCAGAAAGAALCVLHIMPTPSLARYRAVLESNVRLNGMEAAGKVLPYAVRGGCRKVSPGARRVAQPARTPFLTQDLEVLRLCCPWRHRMRLVGHVPFIQPH